LVTFPVYSLTIWEWRLSLSVRPGRILSDNFKSETLFKSMNKNVLTCSTHVLSALEVNINMSLCTRDNRCQGTFTCCRQLLVYDIGCVCSFTCSPNVGRTTRVNNSNVYIYALLRYAHVSLFTNLLVSRIWGRFLFTV
jgi:hypothetical protein